jgi:hypothetical protein
MTDTRPPSIESLPSAVVRPERRASLAWLVPLAVVVFLASLGVRAWMMRGTRVTIRFADGHGLATGDPVRHRGITVGEVLDVRLTENLEGILVRVALRRAGRDLATRGAHFWIERPRIDLRGVKGLDTLAGARYIAIEPGAQDGDRQRHFVGIEDPPAVDRVLPEDLEISLVAEDRGGLSPGAPLTYRGCRIGTVLSVSLAEDANVVEAWVQVEAPYTALVREESRFWLASGARAEIGLTGVSLSFESLESLLTGAVALATPPPDRAGAEVRTGHRFTLNENPDDDWLEWEPSVAIGALLAHRDAPLPALLRARSAWRQGRIVRRERSRHGWALFTERGLLGPADLLMESEDAREGTAILEVAGVELALGAPPEMAAGGVALRATDLSIAPWPAARLRAPEGPEACLAVTDRSMEPLPIAVDRITLGEDGRWEVDPALPFDESWHGAAVVARGDGRIIGVMLVRDGRAQIGPLVLADG